MTSWTFSEALAKRIRKRILEVDGRPNMNDIVAALSAEDYRAHDALQKIVAWARDAEDVLLLSIIAHAAAEDALGLRRDLREYVGARDALEHRMHRIWPDAVRDPYPTDADGGAR